LPDKTLIGKRFEYLSKIGLWQKGTIIGIAANENLYVAHLDCQRVDETWEIAPEEISKRYFIK